MSKPSIARMLREHSQYHEIKEARQQSRIQKTFSRKQSKLINNPMRLIDPFFGVSRPSERYKEIKLECMKVPKGLSLWEIHSDGGVRGGIKNMGYGSFRITTPIGQKIIRTIPFGPGFTSTGAELMTLFRALVFIRSHFECSGNQIRIYSDCQSLISWASNGDNLKVQDSREVKVHIAELVKDLNVKFIWVPRQEIVKILGH